MYAGIAMEGAANSFLDVTGAAHSQALVKKGAAPSAAFLLFRPPARRLWRPFSGFSAFLHFFSGNPCFFIFLGYSYE
jgi:hypothetical protein